MGRDHLTQLAALGVAIIALVGASLLSGPITEQRRDLQIDAEVTEGGMPAKYAILTTALGSFRGLAVDALWYRIEHLKRDGKYHEINTLARWITTLQPRFPQVWAFHGWNMAYNVSVKTHTPAERWDWVNKGIRLLRDEGLVYNPSAVRIYRELAWIYFHKVGQFTDDMHWYYKQQLADEWSRVLGPGSANLTTEQAIENFRPIADMSNRYAVYHRPNRQVRDLLEPLRDQLDRVDQQFDQWRFLDPVTVEKQLRQLESDYLQDGRTADAQRLKPAIEAIAMQNQAALADPVQAFSADYPKAGKLIDALSQREMPLDGQHLRQLGRIEQMLQFITGQQLLQRDDSPLSPSDRQLLQLRIDPQYADAWPNVKAFWRARVLRDEYHMDPDYMFELMEDFGPLDWRHPASHAAYFAFLGVDRAGQVRDKTKIDIINTDRLIIHSMQSLMHYGRITIDPMTGRVDLSPDPRFIDAYDRAMDAAMVRVESGAFNKGAADTFHAGHENFLITAAQYAFLYGDIDKAQTYYTKARRMYGDKAHNQRTGRYNMPLADFIAKILSQGTDSRGTAGPLVESMLQRGFIEGLSQNRPTVYQRFESIARVAHKRYQNERVRANPNATQMRLALPPFNEMRKNVFVNIMNAPGITVMNKVRLYQNVPPALQKSTFRRFQPTVYRQAQQMGLDPQRAFPPPPGIDADDLPIIRADELELDTTDSVERQ